MRGLLIFFSFSLLVVAGGLDWVTGYEISSIVFYALPVAFAAWHLSGRSALVFVCISSICWLWVDSVLGHQYLHPWVPYVNGISRFVLWFFIALAVRYMRRTLNLANRKIEAFSGPIPVCTQCHRVCDQDQSWMAVETFLSKYADAKPLSKVCPDCSRGFFAGARH